MAKPFHERALADRRLELNSTKEVRVQLIGFRELTEQRAKPNSSLSSALHALFCKGFNQFTFNFTDLSDSLFYNFHKTRVTGCLPFHLQ
jgi:hypothetical protein